MCETVRLSLSGIHAVARDALVRAGLREDAADALASATAAAEAEGNSAVGLEHLPFYLDALRAGRIDGRAEPEITRPLPAIVHADARGGTAHLGYERSHRRLVEAAKTFGVAVFAQKNAYTCGALGWFVQRLALEGLVAVAATNGPALMTAPGSRRAVYCTNPLAFAAPLGDGATLLIDQASSQTAYVKVKAAAERGEPIPPGWAIDTEGRPTTDATAAIRGALLSFGGTRGANIALMVEVLAAGLTGANWSLDAPSISAGDRSPGTGLFIAAIAPESFGDGFSRRLADHMARLEAEGIHVPGRTKENARRRAEADGVEVATALVKRIGGAGPSAV